MRVLSHERGNPDTEVSRNLNCSGPSPYSTYVTGGVVSEASPSVTHAVRWSSGSWGTPADLGALSNPSSTPSLGYAVNSAGQVVGISKGGDGHPGIYRAFRAASGASISSASELSSFIDSQLDLNLNSIDVSTFESSAAAINTGGAAVGWSDAAVLTWWDGSVARGEKQHRAHYWGTDGVPFDLGVLPGADWSEATAINDPRSPLPAMVVGWSGSSTDATARVGFISGGAGTTMVSLQDQHLFAWSAESVGELRFG